MSFGSWYRTALYILSCNFLVSKAFFFNLITSKKKTQMVIAFNSFLFTPANLLFVRIAVGNPSCILRCPKDS